MDKVSPHKMTLDPEIQSRAQLDMIVIQEYAKAMRDGAQFPPIKAVQENSTIYVYSGFHRTEAAKKADVELLAEIQPGTFQDAQWLAAAENQDHGLRRSNADKRRAVEKALIARPDKSNVGIAQHCGVSDMLVGDVRRELESTSRILKSPTRTGADGRTIDTSNIGKPKEPEPEEPPQEPLPLPEDEPPEGEPEQPPESEPEPEPQPESPKPQFYETTNASQSVAVTIFSSETNEYYTPPKYVEAARQVMGGIDLDPASNERAQEWIKAGAFYTAGDDGLSQTWHGRVWLNPPYGTDGGQSNQGIWAQRLIEEYQAGQVSEGILLVKAALGYNWFEDLWYNWPVCFAKERISFIKADGSSDGQSKQGTAFFYFGSEIERFIQVFRQFGRVILTEVI